MANLTAVEEKIKLLIAKAERTDNEHERDTFMAHAERLMLKHGIQQAMLKDQDPNEIVEVRIDLDGIYADGRANLINLVLKAIGLYGFTMNTWRYEENLKKTKIIRFVFAVPAAEQQAAESILRSLDLQAMVAMKRWGRDYFKANRYFTGMEKFKMRREFIRAFSHTVSSRIAAERREATKEAAAETGIETSSLEVVLASKAQVIERHLKDKYDLRSTTSRQSSSGYADGAVAGRAAGVAANIGGSRSGIGTGSRAISR